MLSALLARFRTTPAQGGQETRAAINLNPITDPGILKIGATNINLNDAGTQFGVFDTYSISFENGILSVNTTENLDVVLAQLPSEINGEKVKGLCIKTPGNITLTGNEKLVLEHGLVLDGNEVKLDTLISPRTGLVKVTAQRTVELHNIIAASGVIVDAPAITNTATLATHRLSMNGKKLIQKGKLITSTKDIPADCIRGISAENPTHKLFIDAFNHLSAQVKNRKENVRKPINERSAAEIIQSGFVEIIKDVNKWIEPRSKITFDEVVIGKDCEIGGAKLDIEAKDSLKIYGKIKVDDLMLDSNYIYGAFKSTIDGVSKLSLRGRKLLTFGQFTAVEVSARVRYILALFSGNIWASEKISINSLLTAVALGGRLWARDVFVSGGSYWNLLGWSAAHNFIVDTFVPIGLGLHTPYAIRSFKELKDSINFPKLMGTLKTIANFIYKPFGILFRAILKIGTIVRSGLKLYEIYQKYKDKRAAREAEATAKGEVVIVPASNYEYTKSVVNDLYAQALALSDDPIDAMNIMLAFKNIAFAANAIGDVQNVIEEAEKTPLNIPTDYVSARAAVQNNVAGFALCWTPLFAPCKVWDSWRGVDADASVTGYKVMTHSSMIEVKDREILLLEGLPKLVNKLR